MTESPMSIRFFLLSKYRRFDPSLQQAMFGGLVFDFQFWGPVIKMNGHLCVIGTPPVGSQGRDQGILFDIVPEGGVRTPQMEFPDLPFERMPPLFRPLLEEPVVKSWQDAYTLVFDTNAHEFTDVTANAESLGEMQEGETCYTLPNWLLGEATSVFRRIAEQLDERRLRGQFRTATPPEDEPGMSEVQPTEGEEGTTEDTTIEMEGDGNAGDGEDEGSMASSDEALVIEEGEESTTHAESDLAGEDTTRGGGGNVETGAFIQPGDVDDWSQDLQEEDEYEDARSQ